MLVVQAVVLALAVAVAAKRVRSEDDSASSSEESGSNESRLPIPHDAALAVLAATTARPEAVLDKFVETLVASERYLKLIETVERKLNSLDASFHERSANILKYSSEILRSVRALPHGSGVLQGGLRAEPPAMEAALRRIRHDLDALLHTVAERVGLGDAAPAPVAPRSFRGSLCSAGHADMLLRLLVAALVVAAAATAAAGRDKKKSNLNDWREDFEEKLSDAVLTTAGAAGRNGTQPSSRSTSDDAVIEKLLSSILSSEKYLKKVDSIDYRLNRLDIEVHEKTDGIMKFLDELTKLVKTEGLRPRADAEKTEQLLLGVRADVGHLKYLLERSGERPQDAHYPSYLDSKLETIEGSVKNVMAGVDAVLGTMAEVKNRQYSRIIATKGDGDTRAIDASSLIQEFRRTLQEQRYKKCDCKSGRRDRSERYPTDCLEVQMQGFNVTGIYKIRPDEMDSFYVLCDLNVAGGGWTVFQNRFDGSQDFFKSWFEYKHGFGNLAGEFWLGLDKLHYLTDQKLYELRVEMETPHGHEAYAGYSVFTVGPEHEGYRISTLGTYYGTAGDSLSYHAGQKFSTPDVDNDAWADGACTAEHGGAWWYKECDKSNLNGKYVVSGDEHARAQSMYWVTFKGSNSPLARTRMMLRPLPATRPADYDQARKFLEGHKLRALHPNKGKKPYAFEAHSDDFFSEFV